MNTSKKREPRKGRHPSGITSVFMGRHFRAAPSGAPEKFVLCSPGPDPPRLCRYRPSGTPQTARAIQNQTADYEPPSTHGVRAPYVASRSFFLFQTFKIMRTRRVHDTH